MFEALTEEQADLKAAACQAYETENPTGRTDDVIKQIAAAVGNIRLVDYAEQYALVRQVRR